MQALARRLRVWLLALYLMPILVVAVVMAGFVLSTSSSTTASSGLGREVESMAQVGRALEAAATGRSGEAFDVWASVELTERHPVIAGHFAAKLTDAVRLESRVDHYVAAYVAADGARALAVAQRWSEASLLREKAARILEQIGEHQAAAAERSCAKQHAEQRQC